MPGEGVKKSFRNLLDEMSRERAKAGTLEPAVGHFLKVTDSYWPGLFHCYEVPDLPRTNNDLEGFFGTGRYNERRATGRKTASPGMVLRGSVRLVASVATSLRPFSASDIRPAHPESWKALRAKLDERCERRREQLRFRRDPEGYLAKLEEGLLKLALPP